MIKQQEEILDPAMMPDLPHQTNQSFGPSLLDLGYTLYVVSCASLVVHCFLFHFFFFILF